MKPFYLSKKNRGALLAIPFSLATKEIGIEVSKLAAADSGSGLKMFWILKIIIS